jgi:hypothetical protein
MATTSLGTIPLAPKRFFCFADFRAMYRNPLRCDQQFGDDPRFIKIVFAQIPRDVPVKRRTKNAQDTADNFLCHW